MTKMRNSQHLFLNLKRGHAFEDPGVDGRIILKWILMKYGLRMLSRLVWLWVGTSGGLFWKR
jgi:hypothetical protein